MKFAEISYSTKKEDFGIKGFFLKFPNYILNWYLMRFCPFYIQQTTLANVEGYTVKIYKPYENYKTEKQIQKLILLLQKKETDVLLIHHDMLFPHIIDIAYGNIINALFVLDISKKAIKRQSQTLQQSKFLIIDGENDITNMVLDILYPHVNYLSIYTEQPQNFFQKADEIYEEYGLRLEIFSDIKNKQFETFNIILNCSENMYAYDYKIQKNAFFFDMIQNHKKMRCLMSRRNDLLLSNGLLLKWENKNYSSKQIEAILRITEHSFHNFLCYNKKQKLNQIVNLLQHKNITITAFTCFEKRI
ncbi:hypothetical protein AAK894_08795 [Lachnospiraceae bacterium 46-61]